MDNINIKVLGARAVIKEDKQEKATGSGFVIQGRDKEPTFRGTVIGVGDGALLECGTVVPMKIKVSDRVIYTNFSGSPIMVDGNMYVIINERDVLAIIN